MLSTECFTESQQMAFSPENERWVRGEVQSAIGSAMASLSPFTRTQKLLRALKDWGLTATFVTIPLALSALVVTLGLRVVSDVKDEAAFRTHTEDRLNVIEQSLLSLRISTAAESPSKNSSQSEAKQALAQAKKAKVSLPKSVIQDGGKSFIAASKEASGAWPVALEFAAYRTTLNSSPVTPSHQTQKVSDTFYLQTHIVPGKAPKLFTYSAMPIDRAARYDIISAPLPNRKFGPVWLIADGGEPILDGENIRRVIFRNAVIHYAGGPVILENVVFVNCTFVFENVPNGRQLGNQILMASNISWRPEG